MSLATPLTFAAQPLVWHFEPLAVLLLVVGTSPRRRRALPVARLASPSAAPEGCC